MIEEYQARQGIGSQRELTGCIREAGWFISESTVNKYLSGEREVTDEFIYYVARCMQLTDEQVDALVNACAADWHLKRMRSYRDMLAKHGE